MTKITNGINTLILTILMLTTLVMIILGFMLGFSHPLPWILISVVFIIPFIHDKIVAKRFIKWNDSYSVGIESIDNDHKKLLSMTNQLQTAAQYSTDDSMIENILNDMMYYTQYHFSREESLMQQCNYPGLDDHKRLHKAMITQISKFIDEYRIEKTKTIDDVTQFLKTWWINHINGNDQDYSPYLKGKVK